MLRYKAKAIVVAALIVALVMGGYISRVLFPLIGKPAEMGTVKSKQSSASSSAATEVTGYVCPMHSHITSPHEGKCPICGMDLVAQSEAMQMPMPSDDDHPSGMPPSSDMASMDHDDEHAPVTKVSSPAGAPMQLDSSARVALGLRLGKAMRGELSHEIETVGKITRVDSTARVIASSPIAGKLIFVADKIQGDDIKKGDLLFTIASDDLKASQKTFQAAIKTGKTEEAEVLAADLSQRGLSAEQITSLRNGAEPILNADFYAEKDAFVFIRRGEIGDDVTPGFTVFNLGGNKRQIEVTAELFEQQWGWVQEGQKAELEIRGMPGKVFEGSLVRIDPPVGFTTRSLEVRIVFESDDKGISPNVFGRVRINAYPRRNILLVPMEAVIRTGAGDRVVVVRENGAFQTMPVLTGEESHGMTEILSGLSDSERIVVSGQFLIDSESSRLADMERLSHPMRDETVAAGDAEHAAH